MSEMRVSAATTSRRPLSLTAARPRPCQSPDYQLVGYRPRVASGIPRNELEDWMAHRVTLIPGDGVGPELSEATRRVLEATGVAFDWDVQDAGAEVMDRYGTPLPAHVLDS